jgi:hypothetical protein
MLAKRYGDLVIPLLLDADFSADYFCAYKLNICKSPTFTTHKPQDYVDRLLNSKPANLKNNNYVNTLYKSIEPYPNRSKLRILHVSDIHIDP